MTLLSTPTLVALIALAAALLAGGIMGLFLVAGLFQARSLLRREFGAYFVSPIAYVVLVVFLIVTGYLFYQDLQLLTETGPRGVEFPMQVMVGNGYFWMVFVFIAPLLTMRLFAEERSTGTLEMLMTAPVRDWQVVLSKYVACLAFYTVLWLPTLAYMPVLLDLRTPEFTPVWTVWSILLLLGLTAIVGSLLSLVLPLGTGARATALGLFLGGVIGAGVGGWMHYTFDPRQILIVPAGIDPMPVLSSYLGLFLAGAMFLALGMFVSSLVRSQMVAALVSLVLSLVFIVGGFWRPTVDPSSTANQVLDFLSVPVHFSRDFSRGLIDSRPLVLYASVAVFFVFLTVRSLESRRWR